MRVIERDGSQTIWNLDCSPVFLGYDDNNPEGKTLDCPNLIVRPGQTFGEAANLSTCMCGLCRILRRCT
jgi:hypothetical protein